jgi:hypothetical protein
MKRTLCTSLLIILLSLINCDIFSQKANPGEILFGKATGLQKFTSEKPTKDTPLKWINVNTDPATWHLEKDMLVCSGQPIGVMRSEKQYENFILHVEWMHMEAGGNSGMFVWSNANPAPGQRLPDGVEVQMLELDWVNLNKKDGVAPPVAYVHGELFGVGGVQTQPDNPRGTRSKSIENRCKGKGEWNTYDVVCVDGVIRLSVNGKFVNGITRASQKKGYICLESEGAEIHFRNIRLVELDPGVTPEWKAAPVIGQERQTFPPLSLHPENPHYFLFRGEPTILIGSTEHYGAVMNLDFDYITYFNELASYGLNVTRTFSGIYVEPQGAFRIEKNTLAPASGRFICPWARSPEPGYKNGGNKFDLSKWDEAYFTRLKDFIAQAGRRNIVVELDLFSNIYDTLQWQLSPLHYTNNINGVEKIEDWKEVLSLSHHGILKIQEDMVRKIVSELKDFDNLYYEVCNEPYFGDTLALRQWEDHMTTVVDDAQKEHKMKHLISNNIANDYKLVPSSRPHVSIYNFHYANPPRTVGANYHLNSVIGDNETGFDGIDDLPYRKEAWDFILAGGALYNNLDYSFTADNEDGSFVVRKPQPGGGGKTLRFQLKTLIDFINNTGFVKMQPLGSDVIRLPADAKTTVNALGNDDALVLYLNSNISGSGATAFEVNLKSGNYKLTWTDTRSAEQKEGEISNHQGGWAKISTPKYSEDIALKIERK